MYLQFPLSRLFMGCSTSLLDHSYSAIRCYSVGQPSYFAKISFDRGKMYVGSGVPRNDVTGHWTTTPFECLKDEETCWWGSWCCCLLSARNAESFGVGSSYMQAWGFVAMICISALIFIFLPPLGLVLMVVGLIAYAYYKAEKRSRIRTLYDIPGTIMSDFILHCFCPCCAVAQEGREAIAKDKKPIDFWYGEDLAAINFPQTDAAGAEGYAPSSPTGYSATEEGNEVSLLERLKNISLMSHLILRLWLAVVAATFTALIVMGRGISIVVLLLVFVQPFLILYFVYWRDPERNKHVSLDYVIKLFAVGFFMSTSQSIVFESILEGILGVATQILLLIFNPSMGDSDDADTNDAAGMLTKSLMPIFHKEVNWGTLITSAATNTYMFLFSSNTPASMDQHHQDASAYTDSHLRSENGHVYYPHVAETRFLSSTNGTDEGGFTPELMRKNFFIVIAALLVMAFVIAAGVEETMKHFAVRCCRFPAPLKDPKSVLVYMMTAALGFATSENIEYVFGTNRSPLPGTSLLVGELFVLLIRICMPIHVICSVMQATTLSKVLMKLEDLNIFQVLLPALVLHGTFDFVLFLLAAIQAAEFKTNDAAVETMSYMLPVMITFAGIYFAVSGYRTVLVTFENGWQSLPSDGAAPEAYL